MPFVFDIEADGLLDTITKIHCLCYHDLSTGLSHVLRDSNGISDFIIKADVLIGHNIIRYDIPALKKVLGIRGPIRAELVDTLALSWYLEPERFEHGLESWGDDLGIAKPFIADWNNQSIEDYIHRCSEDVKINTKLWNKFRNRLTVLYEDWDKAKTLIAYLSFKMDCAAEQERSKWKFDRAYALESIKTLTELKEGKLATLVASMPSTPVYAHRSRPNKPFKKDRSYSVTGAKWFALLAKHNLPENYDGTVDELIGNNLPNPGSSKQVKDWLYGLGWKPITFKFQRDKVTNEIRKIPQINLEHGGGLCPSVRKLDTGSNGVSELEQLGVINHRLGLLNGFIRDSDDNDFLAAKVSGLTNTLRFIHSEIVNLPKVNAKFGEEIRGCLISEEGKELCGSDMASLEDRLKQHYIYPYDPEYVKEMNVDGYDPHLSLAELAGEVTPEQVVRYKTGQNKSIKPIRDIFKNGNYACQYGAMPPRLALTANIDLEKAKQVWEAYWKKNWAIKEVAKDQRIKKIRGQMWLFNPVSKLWYSLRHEKDVFSTLVQGTAAYVFDKWVEKFRSKRPQLTGQFHDEVVLSILKGHREEAKELLLWAIKEVNEELKLNRELSVDVQFGNRYSEIH